MKKECIRPYQLAQLRLLKAVGKICREQKIQYYLAWGTLLGAIREGGCIPWDADIDIMMFRQDYDRFCDYMMHHAPEPLVLCSWQTDPNHISPHAIVRIRGTHVVMDPSLTSRYQPMCDGIYLDIFPIDEVSEDPALQHRQRRAIGRLQKLILYKRAPIYGRETAAWKRMAKYALSFLLTPVSLTGLQKKIDRLYRLYDGSGSGIAAVLTEPEAEATQTFRREMFGSGRTCLFEGMEYPVPEKAEQCLQITYGDYRKLPPEEGRYAFLDLVDHVDYGSPEELERLC